MFEKSKIRSYLRKVDKNKNAFDYLLLDYLSGKLKSEFKSEKISWVKAVKYNTNTGNLPMWRRKDLTPKMNSISG